MDEHELFLITLNTVHLFLFISVVPNGSRYRLREVNLAESLRVGLLFSINSNFKVTWLLNAGTS